MNQPPFVICCGSSGGAPAANELAAFSRFRTWLKKSNQRRRNQHEVAGGHNDREKLIGPCDVAGLQWGWMRSVAKPTNRSELGSRIFASWNQTTAWLRRLREVAHAAGGVEC